MSSVIEHQPLWEPSEEMRRSTELTRFMDWAGERHGGRFADYSELWQWSVDELEDFWADIWEFCGVRASKPYERVLASHEMPGTSWFEGAELNYAENVLLADRDPQAVAIVHTSELRPLRELTWGELSICVAEAAGGLRALGVVPGDRVVAYMPNILETVIAFLAVSSIGAVWSSAAPEFGARSVIDRFAQIEPKVLLAIDGYRYGGKDFDRREVVKDVAAEIPSLERVVTLGYLDGSGWEDGFLDSSGSELQFAPLAFDHPLWVLYSSGTTGLPKPIVHGQGGILVEQLKKMHLHIDAQ